MVHQRKSRKDEPARWCPGHFGPSFQTWRGQCPGTGPRPFGGIKSCFSSSCWSSWSGPLILESQPRKKVSLARREARRNWKKKKLKRKKEKERIEEENEPSRIVPLSWGRVTLRWLRFSCLPSCCWEAPSPHPCYHRGQSSSSWTWFAQWQRWLSQIHRDQKEGSQRVQATGFNSKREREREWYAVKKEKRKKKKVKNINRIDFEDKTQFHPAIIK